MSSARANRFEVNKLFIEQLSSEPKVKIFIPIYEPLKTETCKKCGKLIAQPKELIKIERRESLQVVYKLKEEMEKVKE